LGNFSVDILEDSNHAQNNNNNNKQELSDFIEEFELKSQFNGSITKVESQLNHV
jgi:hypothetical protein